MACSPPTEIKQFLSKAMKFLKINSHHHHCYKLNFVARVAVDIDNEEEKSFS